MTANRSTESTLMSGDEMSRIINSIRPRNCALGTRAIALRSTLESLALLLSPPAKVCSRSETLEDDEKEPAREFAWRLRTE